VLIYLISVIPQISSYIKYAYMSQIYKSGVEFMRPLT